MASVRLFISLGCFKRSHVTIVMPHKNNTSDPQHLHSGKQDFPGVQAEQNMAGLLEYAAKYLPELERISKEVAEIAPPAEGVRRKRPKRRRAPRLDKYIPFPPYLPPPPPTHPCPSLSPQCMQHHSGYLPMFQPPLRKPRKKITLPRREMKAGSMLKNVCNALEDFQKKRDKFLNYLAQLQHDINNITLPSASKEKIDIKTPKEGLKKRKKIGKPKVKKIKEKEKDIASSEINQNLKNEKSTYVKIGDGLKKPKLKESVFV